MIAEARDLIAGEDALDDFLVRPALVDCAALRETQGETVAPPRYRSTVGQEDDVGSVIGPYTVLELIGEGGMGRVYRARQHEPVAREVAIKLIRSVLADPRLARRFRSECRALARLTHPNVARMVEAGTAEDGRPFFVMELIEGLPLVHYCDRNRLTIEARVELFVDVCRDVQHAHQKQILHRDLKPSNILVTEIDGRPVPKIIDFGIAKLLDAGPSDETAIGEATCLGTPHYMSPEALRSRVRDDLDTRADVYALGVVLYELLTGVRPFEIASSGVPGLVAQILEQRPPSPSVRLRFLEPDARARAAHTRGPDPGRLAQHLEGDLDAIVMTAIDREFGRRYPARGARSAPGAGFPGRALRGGEPGAGARSGGRRP